MSTLTAPRVAVRFEELARTVKTRGDRGTVAMIVRDAAEVAPLVITDKGQIPTTLGKENQAYIERALLGYVYPPKAVTVCVIPPASGVEEDSADALGAALDCLCDQEWDYICGPLDCTAEEAEAIKTRILYEREEFNAKYAAVLPNCAADDPAIINFAATDLARGETEYTAAEYCSRIAGILCGTPYTYSGTYAPMPELSGAARLSRDDQDKAVGRGELIAIWDRRKAKLCRAVNSLTTTDKTRGDSFKSIKLVRLMDTIRTDIVSTVEDEWIGRLNNSYDNKLLLVVEITKYLQNLEDQGLLSGFTVGLDVDAQQAYLESIGVDTAAMSEDELRQADTGTHVFIKAAAKLLNSMEDAVVLVRI